jgi:hypothetical protein
VPQATSCKSSITATSSFTKAPQVLRGMGLGELDKTEAARGELRDAGLL